MADGMSLSIGDWKKLVKSGELELKVVSNSMYPTLKIGDLVKVLPLNGATPQKGVVTVFYKEGEKPPLIVHRCVGDMVFRGDNRVFDDPPVSKDQLVGYVKELVREGKNITVDGSKLIKLYGCIRRIFIRVRCLPGKLKRLVKGK